MAFFENLDIFRYRISVAVSRPGLNYPFSTIVHIVKADKKTRARAAITQQPYVVSLYVFLACSYYTKGAISRELLASFYSCS